MLLGIFILLGNFDQIIEVIECLAKLKTEVDVI